MLGKMKRCHWSAPLYTPTRLETHSGEHDVIGRWCLVAANAPNESRKQSATVILEGVSVLPVGLTEGPTCRNMSGIDVWMSGIDKSRYVPGMSGIDV